MNSVFYLSNYVELIQNKIDDSQLHVYRGYFDLDFKNKSMSELLGFNSNNRLREIEDLYPGYLFGGLVSAFNDRATKLRLLGNSLRIRDNVTTVDDLFRVRVYKNLHRNTFSLQKRGLVIAYAHNLLMTNVNVVINKAGKDRAIKTKQRNVHAFLEGNCYTHIYSRECSNLPRKIKYSPECGFTVNGEVRTHFDCVKITGGQAFEIKLN